MNGSTNEKINYYELKKQSVTIAKSMHFAGLRKNDVVGIVSENRSEFPIISFGAFYVGAIVTPINFTYTERKLDV